LDDAGRWHPSNRHFARFRLSNMAADYTPRQISRLARLISRRMDLQRLKLAVTLGLGTELDNYSLAETLVGRILDLCNKVNTEGKIGELVAGLKQANPNPDLAADLDRFLLRGARGDAEACDALVVTELPPLPVVNRGRLRSHLGQMINPNSGYHVVSINGPKACGKTHSKELIRYVAKCIGVTPLHVNVMADQTQPRTLRQVMELIVFTLVQGGYEEFTRLLSDQPTDAQAAERFVAWLSGRSQGFLANGNRYWISLDNLDRASAEAVRELLVPQFLRAIADGNLHNIKLFLLGDNGKRVREASAIVLHEEALNLPATEIRAFLQQYAASVDLAIPDDELDDAVAYIVGGNTWPFDHTAMEEIRERLDKVVTVIDDPARSMEDLLKGIE
jgi:hypothetical protein